MQKGLVSIVTPCYNAEKYIHRLLDSVLIQTYQDIEMYVIDDGSTDNSKEIIKSYIPRFVLKGYSLHYVYQSNSGQSVALQNGLDRCKGEFFVWPDSDDYYSSSEAIKKMAQALCSKSDEYGMVRTYARVIDELELKEIGTRAASPIDTNLFEDCLFGLNRFNYTPGDVMIRLSVLKESSCLPIYMEKDAGQNWQILLPILWNSRCYTIHEFLYNILDRADSHSRGQYKGYHQVLNKFRAYKNTLLGTLDRIINMSDNQRKYYKELVEKKYSQIDLNICFTYCKHSLYRHTYRLIKKEKIKMSVKYRMMYYISFFCMFKIFNMLKPVVHLKCYVKNRLL